VDPGGAEQATVVDAQHGASSVSAPASLPMSNRDRRPGPATRYTFITPYLAGSIWQDANLWVRGTERDGAKIQYQLDT
jgi:hypothetical protein